MLERLTSLFRFKNVRITHTNPLLKTVEGLCVAIHETPGASGHFNIELEGGRRFGFVPEVITSDSVDGELNAFAGGRRRIQIM